MKSILACVVFAITGCAGVPIMSAESLTQARIESAALVPTRTNVQLTVIWVDSRTIGEHCGPRALACARVTGAGGIIHAAMPRSWNDDARLRTLGHELMHILGGQHD